MKLPFLTSKPKIEYFLSLVLRDDKINAFIFEKNTNIIKVVNSQEESFSESLDKTSYEDLLDAADKVISQAEDELDLPAEVQKTIFGLKDTWVKDAKIKPEYLGILKKLSDSLGLIPIGFLTVNEAVVSLLQKEEGAPPSAIFVDVGKETVSVASVRAGKVIEVKTAEVHQTPVFTVDTLLKHFEVVEILPAKVVLLNEDEELVQEFISHQWSKSLPFLHLPQIVSLQNDSIGKAFAIGLANQTGSDVVLEEFESAPSEGQGKSEEVQEKVKVEEQTKETPPIEEPLSNIKFVDSPDFFGFTKSDVAKAEHAAQLNGSVPKEPQVFEEIPEDVALKETKKQMMPAAALVVLAKIRDFLAELLTKIKGLNIRGLRIPSLPKGPMLYALAPLALLFLLLAYYLFFLKATIVLSVTPKVEQKNLDINFSTTTSDFKQNTIKADFTDVSEDGTTTIATTGKKETGDKAKGTVNVFNFSNSKVTFPAKSKLTSSNNLGFLTTSDITIASRSADSPGKTSVSVEAEKFGTEYNLPSLTSFTSSNSDVSAKNDNPFSGGTKKEIQVVSKDDVNKVQDDLIKSLKDKARDDIKGKISANKDLLPDFIDTSIDKKSFDKKEDEEAKSVKLTATVSFQALAYDKDELLNFLKTVFPSSVTIDKNNIELSFEDIKKKGGEVTTRMNAKVKIVPKINIDDLRQKVSGKSFSAARVEVLKIPQVEDADIRFSPNIGFLPKTLPRISKNIRITISQND